MKKLLFALSAVLLVFSTCSMSHEWVVLLPNEELCYPFGPNEHLSDHFFGREDHTLPKVFRHMYAKQKPLLPLTSSGEPVPPLFESPTLMDVTDTAHRQMVRLTRKYRYTHWLKEPDVYRHGVAFPLSSS